jgi:hypothetical protein
MFFHQGVSIKKGWDNIIGDSDIIKIKDEVYSTLKEYFPLPKLRKENHLLENDINTSFQTILFDMLNEQNDLYDFYCDMSDDIFIRNNTLPLSEDLESLNVLIKEFTDSDVATLSKYKWYANDIIEDYE